MSDRLTRPAFHSLLAPALFTAVFLLLTASVINAQEATSTRTARTRAAGAKNSAAKAETVKPVFSEYKGVHIGMSTDEVRKKLTDIKDQADDQDFFVFSETESAQVFYQGGKVYAISVNYVGTSGAPKSKDVVGEEIQAKADGSMYQLVRYPDDGYWVSYSRTAGDAPLITVTIQKMQ
jgi:hypothetical protein